MQRMHQPYHKWYDPLHIITWPYWLIDLDLTCSSPLFWSIGAKSLTCPSLLQPVHQAKPHLDLLHLSHMIPCHVSYAMSSFITCVSFVTSLSHFHLHGICCSHTCTCGLITYVSHINIISPPRLSLNYQNHTRTFHISLPGLHFSFYHFIMSDNNIVTTIIYFLSLASDRQSLDFYRRPIA